MLKRIFLVPLAILLIGAAASASVVINPSFFYYIRNEKQSSGNTEFKQYLFNLKSGYLDPSGFYVGLAYDIEDRVYGSGASDQDRKSIGVSVGYLLNGWQFLATSYFKSKLNDYNGSGHAFEGGYIFDMGGFSMGPLLSYRYWKYTEPTNLSQSNVLPSIQFQITF